MRRIDELIYEVKDGVAYLTLNRPEKRNSLNEKMYGLLEYYIVKSELDDDVQMTVISAAGDKAFCSGGDLGMALEWDEDQTIDLLSPSRNGLPYHSFERCSKLVISSINGLTQAAGLIISLVSDITICSEHATFRVPELLRGLTDPFIPTRLHLYVGLARARWMIFTAGEMSAREAEAAGLVAKVYPTGELDKGLEELVNRIKLTAPVARSYYKKMIYEALGAVPVGLFLESLRNPESHQGMQAFLDKRAPPWAPPEAGRL